jgi:hypothetical protein
MRTLAVVLLVACAGKAPPGPTADAAPMLDCATYCARITTNCTGANVQYGAMNQCMASCASFPQGAISDTSGNTLGCRIYHAGAAAADPTTHCVHAGPSGAPACGAACDGFCSLVVAECSAQYPDANTCATTCAGFATTPAYTANVTSGNSLSCRIYHATAASTDPTTHCPHTASVSAVCQ